MAGMKSIDEALAPLEEHALELITMMNAFFELAGENEPPWLWLLHRRVHELDALIQAYSMAVHQHARPVLNDMAKLTK